MIAPVWTDKLEIGEFRTKVWAAMVLVVAAVTAMALYVGQRYVTATAERDLEQNFQGQLVALHKLEGLRQNALAERCRILAENPRIHAALEDNALDLLYPSAKDELRDLMNRAQASVPDTTGSLHASFYRFLDATGRVLSPPDANNVGQLDEAAEARLAVKQLPEREEIGYLPVSNNPALGSIAEVIAVPIFSTETGEAISVLVVGFRPFELLATSTGVGMKSGIWVKGRLRMPALSVSEQATLSSEITKAVTKSAQAQNNFMTTVTGVPQLVFYKWLNPGSVFPPAYEICLYPLTDYIAQLHRLRWRIVGAGGFLLLGGLVASHFIAGRLAKPVEKLALDSAKDRAERKRAELALASASEELERSTRYSADASHQLKSPVTILRTGLETLLAREDFKSDVYEELSSLLHQTHRLTGVIDDLLLLSRMDAGHLQIDAQPVNLSQLVNEWLDDLEALPDSFDVKIEKDFPADVYVAGEKRYTSLIVENLLENARKYNRAGGRLRVAAHQNGREIVLTIANTGDSIAPSAQQHIFQRFHRGAGGSPISGHGLGLNLARELARLHGGDLRLVHSQNDWTEFEVRFRVAERTPSAAKEHA
jgi:signal transduction histidine kinase